jgi:hypothetical protein
VYRQSSLGDLHALFPARDRRPVLYSCGKTRRTQNKMMAETILVAFLGLIIALGAQAALTSAPKPRRAPTVIPAVPKHSENPYLVLTLEEETQDSIRRLASSTRLRHGITKSSAVYPKMRSAS